MRKFLKILLSVFSVLVLSAIIIPVFLSIIISINSVQNYVVSKAADYAGSKLGTAVSIDNINIMLFNRVIIKGVYVEDLQGDTLIYADKIDAGFRGYSFSRNLVRAGDVTVGGAVFNLKQDSTLTTNLARVLEPLKKEEKKIRKRPFCLSAGTIKLIGLRFNMEKYEKRERTYGVKFDDLGVSDINMEVHRFLMLGDSITANIRNLTFREKSGFECSLFSAENVSVSSTGVLLNNFTLEDRYSKLRMPRMNLVYGQWTAFREFLEEVSLESDLRDCHVDFRTIAFFAPSLEEWDLIVDIGSGMVRGPVEDMGGYLTKTKVRNSEIDVEFAMTGLPEVGNTRFIFDVSRIVTDDKDIELIYNGITGRGLGRAVDYAEGFGRIELSGGFAGYLTDFHVAGVMNSDGGSVNFDLGVEPVGDGTSKVQGSVGVDELKLGEVLSSQAFGNATLNVGVNGIVGAGMVDVNVEAEVGSLYFNGYDFHGLEFDGTIRNNYYEGRLASYDRNADIRVSGVLDLREEFPDYDLDVEIFHADLRALNINKRDSVSVLSLGMRLNGEGTTLDDLNGGGYIYHLNYSFNEDTVRSELVELIAENSEKNRMVALYSDLMDIEMHTKLSYYDMIPYFRHTLSHYISSFSVRTEDTEELECKLARECGSNIGDYYIIKAHVKENRNFVSAIVPELRVSEGTNLSFIFNPRSEDFSVMLESELIEYKNIYASGLNFTNMNQSDSIAVYLRTREAGIGNFYMPDFSLHGGAKNNRINLSAEFINELTNTSALINTVSETRSDTVTGKNILVTRFYTSRITAGEHSWAVTSPAIVFGNGRIDVDRFRIFSAGQQLSVNGVVSDKLSDRLNIKLDNFDIAPLSALIDRYGFGVIGRMNGEVDIAAVSGDRLLYSQVDFSGVAVNGRELPDSRFRTAWNNENERIVVSLSTDGNQDFIYGNYEVREKKYFLNADIPDMDLMFLGPFLKGVLKDIEGTAHAHVMLTGTGRQPELNGSITVKDFNATVDFTNVRYSMKDAVIDVRDGNLYLREAILTDDADGKAELELDLTTRYLADLNYDVRIFPEKLLALNTTVADNDIFYGRLFASGNVNIKGNRRKVDMDIYAVTENNSRIIIPIDDAASILEADFIYFRSSDDTVRTAETSRREELRNRIMNRNTRPRSRSDLEISILLNVTPGVEIQILLDTNNKNELNARGEGILDMKIKPNENLFTMSGNMEIVDGMYDFNLANLPVGKQFSIESGSNIQWRGSPLDAVLNIEAIYRLRASITPLMSMESGSYRQNVPVECVILITDKLIQPTINFDVRVPNADMEIQSVIQNAMNTQELKAHQFVWLLMANSFSVDENMAGNVGTMATVSTGIEFLTNQLSNWFSNDRLRFNFGYKPKSDMSSDEIDISYSQEIIPNKLRIEAEANYNLGNNSANTVSNNVSQLTGDFYITYIIDRMGNFRARAFTRTIDRFDENQGLQESGVGLYYKKDFDTFSELFKRRKIHEWWID